MKYDWVFFDYGGTLTVYADADAAPVIPDDLEGQVLRDWFDLTGRDVTATATHLSQIAEQAHQNIDGTVSELDWHANEMYYRRWMRHVYKQLEVPAPHTEHEMACAWHFVFWKCFERTGVQACGSVIETLETLRQQGFGLGVFSNNNGYVEDTLLYNQTCGFFEIVLDSSHVGFKKPDPEVFRLIARKAKVTCDRIFYVGDNFDADIVGATAVGMGAAWIGGDDRPLPRNAVRIGRFTELLDHLAGHDS